MDTITEYNPLDYENLARNCAEELMRRGPVALPIETRFTGAGVYALFYAGEFPPYATVRSLSADQPIYVGKAVLKGGRKGALTGSAVHVGGTGSGVFSYTPEKIAELRGLRAKRLVAVCKALES